MAASEWILTDWTIAQWEDETNTPFIFFLLEALKLASDERQAYFEQTHSGGFDSDNSFPDFANSIIVFGEGSPNNAVKILNAVFPYSDRGGASPSGPIDHDSLSADGTTVSNSVRPDDLILSELLTGPLGYASGTLLHTTDTDSGADTAPLSMSWFTQWFKVMNYPQYYSFPLGHVTGVTDFFDVIQQQEIYQIEVNYNFTTDDSLAAVATAELTEPLTVSTPVDIYTSGDLDDSTAGVYSTNQEIFDYAVAEFAEHYDGGTWNTISNPSNLISVDVGTFCFMQSHTLTGGLTSQFVDLRQQRRIRFKIKDAFRALSPETFTQLIYHYFYMTEITTGEPTHSYNAFGSGIDEDETKLKQFTIDADGFYYFSIQDPDFSSYTVPTRPATTSVDNRNLESNQIYTLTDGVALGTNSHNIYTKPNIDDGSEFGFYTP